MSKSVAKLNVLHMSGKTVFTVSDLAILWNIVNKNVLRVTIARAKGYGYLESIRRGMYRLIGKDVNKLELAGKLKKNSYISFETVLAHQGVINQWYEAITSASDRKLEVVNEYGEFTYRRLPERVVSNMSGIVNKRIYRIATVERAICDYFYKVGWVYLDDVHDINIDKLMQIAQIYRSKKLDQNIKKLVYAITKR